MAIQSPSRIRRVGLALLVACATIATATGAAGAVDRTDTAPAAASATVPMRLMSVYGVTGEGPNALVMDSRGNVYTANSKSDNVTRITREGYVQVVGVTGKQPMGIALDDEGNV